MVKRLITLLAAAINTLNCLFTAGWPIYSSSMAGRKRRSGILSSCRLPADSCSFVTIFPIVPSQGGIVAIVKQYSEIRIFPLKNGDYLSPVDSDNSVGESLLFGLVSLALGDFLISLALTSAFLSTNSTMAIGAESPRRKPHFNIRT